MKRLLEAINSGILKGLTEKNIEILSDLDSEIDNYSIQTKNINTKTDFSLILAVNKHKYVDLGLPSGNLWADYNVGASEGNRRGGSYQWCNDIDMQPYTISHPTQLSFTTHLVNGKNPKALNFKIPSEFNFDICNRVMGGKWEMPTKQDYLELINNCKIEYNTDEEECIFIGPNGNKLIFPTAEVHRKAYTDLEFKIEDCDAEYMGSYWTRDIDSNNEPFMFTFDLHNEEAYICTSYEDDYCTQARAVLKLSNKKGIHENTLNILSDIDVTSDEDIIIPHKNINNSIDIFELAYHEFKHTVEHNMQHLMQKSKHKQLSNIYVSIFNNPENFERFKGIIQANTKNELKDLIKIGIILLGNDGNFNWIDTSKITDMSGLFSSNSNFNGDISLWDVSNVNEMSSMFYESNFNGNLYNWDVSNVKNMQFMFCKNIRFNTDISRWDITAAFELAYNDIHYPFLTSYTNGGNGIFHAFDNVSKNNLPHKCIQAYNWILNERAKWHKLTESTNRGTQRDLNGYQMKLLSDLDDNSISQLDSLQTKSVNTLRDTNDIIIIKKFIKGIQQYRNSQYLLHPTMLDDTIKNEINNPANFEKYKAIIQPKSNRDFKELILAGIGLLGADGNFNWIDTSKITAMSDLFTTEFNGDISLWDVSNVTDMNNLFVYCSQFNKDISKWDVSNVTDMHNMFMHCTEFNKDISKWDVSNVTIMAGIFAHTQKFNQDIGCWDVSNVTNMSSMFYFANAFNQDISNWDVKNCKRNDFMFTGSIVEHVNRPDFINRFSK